jgi:sugar phosphate isomerase/epimerase
VRGEIFMANVKRSVSLYSFQDEYCRGKMTLEDCIAELERMGVEGVELLSDQMLHDTPFPSEETLKNWDRIMGKYKVKPVCNDIFINTKLYKNRILTRKESTQAMINELKLANRLGFKIVRLVSLTPPEIIEDCLPYAEKYDVVMAQEVHAAMSFDNPETKKFTDIMFKVKSPYLGIVPDVGIFCRKHPRVSKEYFLNLGLNIDLADYIDSIFAAGKDLLQLNLFTENSVVPDEFKSLVKSEVDQLYLLFASGYENSPLDILKPYLPYIKHIHGKCWEITDEGIEYSIPYDQIIRYLQENNYNGYISTEWEGGRFTLPGKAVQGVEQIRRHQAMLKKYIGA